MVSALGASVQVTQGTRVGTLVVHHTHGEDDVRPLRVDEAAHRAYPLSEESIFFANSRHYRHVSGIAILIAGVFSFARRGNGPGGASAPDAARTK